MKKIFLIIAMACCYAKSFAQAYPTPVTDTLGYLRHLVANKQQFIGQPFNKLEDSLQIAVKRFCPLGTTHWNRFIENTTRFSFNFFGNPRFFEYEFPKLEIIWQTTPDIRNSDRLYYQYNKGQYNSTVSQYYRPFVIRDIYLIE